MIKSHFLYVLFLFLLGSCAIQSNPGGGPVDKSPPIVLEETPPNGSIWFTEKEIAVRMDEYVMLKSAAQELIISPPLDETPDVNLKGKTVLIKLKEELADSTTYTIQFGNAIADITEGNVLKDYQYVFSTGGEIDSLGLTGHIFDSYSKEAVEDIKILIYQSENDSGIFKEKPRYFARSNKAGEFRFQNMRAGKYQLFGIEDLNRNYYYDPGERIAFWGQDIILQSDTQGFQLQLFTNSAGKLKLIGSEGVKPGKSVFYFNKTYKDGEISLLNPQEGDSLFFASNSEKDTIYAWTNRENPDTNQFRVKVGYAKYDTITVRYKNLKESSKPSIDVFKRNDYYGLSSKIYIRSSEPIIFIDTSRIIIYEDSNVVSKRFSFKRNEDNPLLINISENFGPGKNYRIYINKNSFRGTSGRNNDSILINFMIRGETDLGAIAIKLMPSELRKDKSLIVELLNSRKKTVRRETILGDGEKEVGFKNLVPGNYSFRFILDANNNGHWDSGNIEDRIQPEGVYYLNQKVELKANWEILDLKFYLPEN